jgi:hypothetical protein
MLTNRPAPLYDMALGRINPFLKMGLSIVFISLAVLLESLPAMLVLVGSGD